MVRRAAAASPEPLATATPRQLEVFRAVVQTGGVSPAARMLAMSQPAVSYQLKQLEAAFGFLLFDRVRGRLMPTKEGTALAAEVERHFVGMREILRIAAQMRGQEAGQLNIGVLPALAFTVMPEVVARFRQTFPAVKVSLQTLSSPTIKDAVATSRLDLGFVANEVDTLGVRAVEFASHSAVIVVPRKHRLAKAETLQPRDLRGEAFVALNPEDATRKPIAEAFRKQGVELHVVAETPYALGVCALVEAGVGIGLVNPLSILGAYRAALKTVPFQPEIRFRHLMLLPPHRPHGRALREFVALARAVHQTMASGARA